VKVVRRRRGVSRRQAEAVRAIAELLVGDRWERLSTAEVGGNIDRELDKLHPAGRRSAKLGLALIACYPGLSLKRSWSAMTLERRRRFLLRTSEAVARGRGPRPWRAAVRAILVGAKQCVAMAYFSDEDATIALGYRPFSERADARSLRAAAPDPGLVTISPEEVGDRLAAEVAVVGSGAAGAVLAYRLAERGRRVLVIERGPYVRPAEFTEDPMEMLGTLYGDGSLQFSRGLGLQVLQGMCVGGSTVVNNALCFDLPDEALRQWNDPSGSDAGLDENALRKAFATVRDWIGVRGQEDSPLNPGAAKFELGVRRLGLDKAPNRFAVVEANIEGCYGCGYCNLGCAYGKKLSMLDSVLPSGQARFGDRLRILPEAMVLRVDARDGVARELVCRLGDRRRVRVEANVVVLAAGALHSSVILQRSRLGGRNVGHGYSFNVGTGVWGDFSEAVDGYAGLQMSHYLKPPPPAGFVLESLSLPPLTQAMFTPGWAERYELNVTRYRHLACISVLVGTRPSPSRLRRQPLTGAPSFAFEATRTEVGRLVNGIQLASSILLAAGALRVVPPTFEDAELRTSADVARLKRSVVRGEQLLLASSHPQGGNAVSRDPALGVVDPTFRVHGTRNVYVCDASVFPTSTGVNPQLTVMALANYAAPLIDAG
jgi:choline dehydrogenase-like flavoprotein